VCAKAEWSDGVMEWWAWWLKKNNTIGHDWARLGTIGHDWARLGTIGKALF
jgi:hypothetical protein